MLSDISEYWKRGMKTIFSGDKCVNFDKRKLKTLVTQYIMVQMQYNTIFHVRQYGKK